MIRQILIGSLLVVFALPAAAQNTCDAGKLKCLRNKLSCLIKVHELSQKKGLPPDAAKLQKCMDKFDGGATPERGCFKKLEAKQDVAKPATVCSKTGDTAAAEADVDTYVAALLSLINATSPSTTTTTTLPKGCCLLGTPEPFCTVIDSNTCTTLDGISDPAHTYTCGANDCSLAGTYVPGDCCQAPTYAPGPPATPLPCAGGLSGGGCLLWGGTTVSNAICEATGCRVCKASGVTCASGSECCSKFCLAATSPKSCL